MFFKKFRRHVRARARRARAAQVRQRKREAEWAKQEMEYQQKIDRERNDGAYMAVESAFLWNRVHGTAEQIIGVRDALIAQRWKPPADEYPIEDEPR